MQELMHRCRDRRWMLCILALFWALLLLTNRALFQSVWLAAFWALICVCSFVCALFIDGMGPRDFLLLAGLMGLFFTVIAPFTCLADEEYHFLRAYNLSGGHAFPFDQGGVPGFSAPAPFADYTGREDWNLLNVWQNKPLWLAPIRSLGTECIPRVRSASYLPLNYMFSALGIGLGRLFNLSLLSTVVLGRLANYAAYVGVTYLAVRKARYYRSLFFLVAVLPCCLYAGATFSIDAPLIAFSLLYVSVALTYCLDETRTRISGLDAALLVVSAAFILSTKYLGYCLLLPLILFAWKRPLANYRRVLLLLCGVTVLIAAWQAGAILTYPGSLDEGAVMENVSIRGQLAWAWANKGRFATLITRDFLQNLFTRLYSYSYTEEPAFTFLSLPLRFLPFIAAARAKDKHPLALKQRRLLNAYWLPAAAAMMLLCNLSLFFAWTPVGADFINGVQPRYTIPYLIFILLSLTTLSPVNQMKNWERRVGFLMSLSLINMVMGSLTHFM